MERKSKRNDGANGPATAPAVPAASGLEENLEKVRDILFGHQVRHLEARIEALEAQLLDTSGRIEADVRANVKALEGKLDLESKRVVGRFRDEGDSRSRDVAKLAGKLDSTETLLRGELTHQEEQTAKGLKALEKRLGEEAKSIRESLAEAQDSANEALSALAEELRDAKADRRTLAALFREVAGRLEGEG